MEDSKKKETLKSSLEKVTLVDAGVKNKYGSLESPTTMKSEKDKIYYPCIYLNSKEAPELKGVEIGQEKTLVINVRIKSHSLNENEKSTNEDFTLEILKIGVIK